MLFSVIVPIYNVEPYLRQCVESILGQTCSDFELILVDDGSPDNCPAICDEYAARDERVRVIHKPNGGLVSARQAGLEIARGEYVVPVDSDDYVKPQMLQRAKELLQRDDSDMVIFGIEFFTDDSRRTLHEAMPEGLYEKNAIRETLYPNILMAPDMTHMFYYVWGKVFRRRLYAPCQRRVDPRISMGEDVTCLMPIYMAAEKITVSHEIMACCRERPGSESRSFYTKQYDQLILGIQALRELGTGAAADFQEQTDRYGLFMFFVQLMHAVKAGAYDQCAAIRGYLEEPEFSQAVRNARYAGVSPKSRITYRLLKGGRVKTAYVFLWLCEKMKEMRKS